MTMSARPKWLDPWYWVLLAYLPIWIAIRAAAKREKDSHAC